MEVDGELVLVPLAISLCLIIVYFQSNNQNTTSQHV